MVHRFTPTVGGGGLPGYVALFKLYTVIFVTYLNQLFLLHLFVIMPTTVAAGKSEL